MTKFILVLLLHFTINSAFSQCALNYSGNFGVRACNSPDTITSYGFNSTIQLIDSSTILIRNFANIPNGLLLAGEDTIFANLNCSADSLTLVPVNYYASGALNYSGTGKIYLDSLRINYYQTNPSGGQSLCYVYVKGITVGIKEFEPNIDHLLELWPNPASSFLNIKMSDNLFPEFEIIDVWGKRIEIASFVNGTIDISHFPEGIYFIQARTSNGHHRVSKMFIKE